MNELSFERMENVSGGDMVNWLDGACAIGGVLSWRKLVMYGSGAGVAFCAGYAVGKWLGDL